MALVEYDNKSISDDISSSDDNLSDEKNNDLPQEDMNFEPTKFFKSKELRYYKMINKYYKNDCTEEDVKKMIDIICGKSIISLRVLDWFATKYSRKKLYVKEKNIGNEFDIYISYKSELKSYKKEHFDPFRRQEKFYHYFDDEKKLRLYTTLGQLNFFKWAISNGVVSYVEKNISQITNAMNSANKEDKKKKDKLKKEKKKQRKTAEKDINIKATKVVSDEEVKITVTFD